MTQGRRRDEGPAEAQVLEVLAHVPLLAAFFRRAMAEMPDELRETYARHGLTARHGAVLTQLLPGQALSVTELAGRLGVSLSTASELVGDLSRAGMAERGEDPANRRRTLVTLADDHRSAFEKFIKLRSEPLLVALENLSPRDREGFIAGLTAWAAAAQ
ncbi:MarR family winged helix-turn-helix transcriptional regulator [Amycolatopsis nigrescens]|uniref:MarR family winged helix-turn-helix transcriptional regulator n=1 Tax=Amycolatopsis nigrescens TaxID=381445 RepID=UPI00035F4437|nr:MarR family transcriptional regulator [Amycolatopsis nigrescens]